VRTPRPRRVCRRRSATSQKRRVLRGAAVRDPRDGPPARGSRAREPRARRVARPVAIGTMTTWRPMALEGRFDGRRVVQRGEVDGSLAVDRSDDDHGRHERLRRSGEARRSVGIGASLLPQRAPHLKQSVVVGFGSRSLIASGDPFPNEIRCSLDVGISPAHTFDCKTSLSGFRKA
jgi:hypothetical protein